MNRACLALTILLASIFGRIALAQHGPNRPPVAGAHNAAAGSLVDTSDIRNQYRQRVLNDFLRRRGSPATVTAQVYSLSFFDPFLLLWNKWETTFGWINRGIYANMPLGQKRHYSGLHPRYVEYRFHDKDGDFLYAQCFLHFYSSRAIPGRVFIRSYQCNEQNFVRTTQGYKGFHFAGVVDLNKSGKISKFKDLTAEWMKDASLDSETKFVPLLNDPTLFEDPNRPARGGAEPEDDPA